MTQTNKGAAGPNNDALHPPELKPIEFHSTENRAPSRAPVDYVPMLADCGMVYDDQMPDLPPMMHWRVFFNGGSNRHCFIATDGLGRSHHVESAGLDGSYRASGPSPESPRNNENYDETFDHAWDAFYTADLHRGHVSAAP